MHKFPRWLLLVPALLMLGGLMLWPKWTVDDAFISYRYGKNWVETGELTWNPGETPKVEGYTGVFLPVLAAASIQMGLAPEETGRWAGILGFILGALALWRIGRLQFESEWTGFVLVMGYITYPFFYTHAHAGLETMVFIGGVLWVFERLGNFIRFSSVGSAITLGLVLVLIGLVRPEGVLLAFALTIAAIFSIRGRPANLTARLMAIILLVYLVPAITYFAWRISYYGDVLPNTYYAKGIEGWYNPDAFWAIARFVLKFMALPYGIVMALLSGAKRQIIFYPSIKMEYGPKMLRLSAQVFGALCAIFYSRVDLQMNYEYRFFLPMLAAFWVWLAPVLANALNSIKRLKIKPLMIPSVLLLCIYLVVLGIKVKENLYFTRYYYHLMEEEWKPVAQTLKDLYPSGAKVAVYMDAGAIGYFSGLNILDMGALNDRFLAHEKPNDMERADYFFAQLPDACVFTSFSSDRLDYIPAAEYIYSDVRFSEYSHYKTFGNSVNFPYFQFLYQRKD